MAVAIALLVVVAAVSMSIGDGSLLDPALRNTLLALRAWRLGCAVLAGASLAVAGTAAQALFQNPLASPDVLGTTAGATLGGQLALLLWTSPWLAAAGQWIPAELLVPTGCLLGAWLALAALGIVAARTADRLGVVLGGVVIASLSVSVAGLVGAMALESWELARALQAFALGGIDGRGPQHVLLAAPLVGCGIVAIFGWSSPLDLLTTGDEEAQALGVDIVRLRRWVVVWVGVLAAAAASIGGNVAFVGLLVPHFARRLIGGSHRWLIPTAATLGAAFLVSCDVIVRALPTGGVVPLGVVTGLLGAPVFAAQLLRARDAS